ncbi:MAG: glycosyltransferase [Natronomonas sp.]
MQIVVVLSDAPPISRRDGASRLVRFAETFAELGHDVTVFCSMWWRTRDDVVERNGVEYEALAVPGAMGTFLGRVTTRLAGIRPDAVLASPTPPIVVSTARLGAALSRAPLVVDWFGDEPADTEGIPGPLFRFPATNVTPSELARTALRERGATETNTVVVPQSIDFSLVESTDPGRPVDFAYARRLDADANLESLLLALAERREAEWTATVVGDGPERFGYERQAEHLRIDDRVTFLGNVDRQRRIELYRGAHAFVQTARRERFAEELLWALACGCVGVVEYQSRSSAHELVERRQRGIRVTDSEDLTRSLSDAQALSFSDIDGEYREFDHEAVAERYLDVFRRNGVEG